MTAATRDHTDTTGHRIATPPVRLLAISGSLRAASSNSALLRAAAHLAPVGVEINLYERLAGLPHFNPDLDDLDGRTAPPEVLDFRFRLDASDGVIISSPEYAHGVPGAIKNAIDWVVSSGELYEKPVALLNASMSATHAYESLLETLTTADANVVREASGLCKLSAGVSSPPAFETAAGNSGLVAPPIGT